MSQQPINKSVTASSSMPIDDRDDIDSNLVFWSTEWMRITWRHDRLTFEEAHKLSGSGPGCPTWMGNQKDSDGTPFVVKLPNGDLYDGGWEKNSWEMNGNDGIYCCLSGKHKGMTYIGSFVRNLREGTGEVLWRQDMECPSGPPSQKRMFKHDMDCGPVIIPASVGEESDSDNESTTYEDIPEPGFVCSDCIYYTTLDNETPSMIAQKFGCNWRDIAKANKDRYGGIKEKSKFFVETILQVPGVCRRDKLELLQKKYFRKRDGKVMEGCAAVCNDSLKHGESCSNSNIYSAAKTGTSTTVAKARSSNWSDIGISSDSKDCALGPAAIPKIPIRASNAYNKFGKKKSNRNNQLSRRSGDGLRKDVANIRYKRSKRCKNDRGFDHVTSHEKHENNDNGNQNTNQMDPSYDGGNEDDDVTNSVNQPQTSKEKEKERNPNSAQKERNKDVLDQLAASQTRRDECFSSQNQLQLHEERNAKARKAVLCEPTSKSPSLSQDCTSIPVRTQYDNKHPVISLLSSSGSSSSLNSLSDRNSSSSSFRKRKREKQGNLQKTLSNTHKPDVNAATSNDDSKVGPMKKCHEETNAVEPVLSCSGASSSLTLPRPSKPLSSYCLRNRQEWNFTHDFNSKYDGEPVAYPGKQTKEERPEEKRVMEKNRESRTENGKSIVRVLVVGAKEGNGAFGVIPMQITPSDSLKDVRRQIKETFQKSSDSDTGSENEGEDVYDKHLATGSFKWCVDGQILLRKAEKLSLALSLCHKNAKGKDELILKLNTVYSL